MTPDAAYRALFAHRQVMADLLTGYAAAGWAHELELASLERARDVFVAEDLRERRSDIIWRVRWRGGSWLYVYVLLEFQRTVDPCMALRMLGYVALLYQDLVGTGHLVDGKVPPVLPIVLYNGEARWRAPCSVGECIHPGPAALAAHLPELRYVFLDEGRMQASELMAERNLAAAVFQLEGSRDPHDLHQLVAAVSDWLRDTDQEPIERAFAAWISNVLMPAHLPEVPDPGSLDLDGIRSMLAERVERWVEGWKAEGMAKGMIALLEDEVRLGERSPQSAIDRLQKLAAAGSVPPAMADAAIIRIRG